MCFFCFYVVQWKRFHCTSDVMYNVVVQWLVCLCSGTFASGLNYRRFLDLSSLAVADVPTMFKLYLGTRNLAAAILIIDLNSFS